GRSPTAPLVPYTTLFRSEHEPNWSEKLPKKSEMLMAYNSFAVSFRERGETAARAVLAEFFDTIDTDAIVTLKLTANELYAMSISDRKSTRLNSSHVKISY